MELKKAGQELQEVLEEQRKMGKGKIISMLRSIDEVGVWYELPEDVKINSVRVAALTLRRREGKEFITTKFRGRYYIKRVK